MSENNDFLSLLGDGSPSRRESLDSISSRRATTPTSRPESRDRTQSKTPSDIRSEDSLWEDDEESIKDMKGFSSVDSILKRLPYFDRKLVPMMEQINLSFSGLSDVPMDINIFTQLRVLCLSHNSIRNLSSMRLVECCPLLTKIDISRNRITNLGAIKELGHLQHLEEIDLRFNPIPIQDNRVAIVQALLFYHPFRPFYPNPEENSKKTKDHNNITDIKTGVSHPPLSFFKTQKRKTLKVKTKYMDEFSGTGPKDTPELKRQHSTSSALYFKRQQSVDNLVSIDLQDGCKNLKPRFMNNTISSLRHMTVSPMEQQSGKTMLQKSVSARNLNEQIPNQLSQLRKTKTTVNLLANNLKVKKPQEVPKKPVNSYVAFAEQQEKMNQFLHDFEMSDMGPFLKSIEQLYQILDDPKDVIERTKLCPVPRSYNTPFPMLKVINGKIMTIGEYMLAENEEIYDICAHNNKKLGKKFTLDPPLLNGRKKILKYKMDFGSESLEKKELQSLNIAECSISDEEGKTESVLVDEEEDYIVQKNRHRRMNQSNKRSFDAEYMLGVITKSKKDAIDLEEIGRTFGVKISSLDQRNLQINHEKWGHIENVLKEPVTISFSETIRKGFSKNKRISDEILGIKKEGTKQIDFRPFKQQILDLSYDEVLNRMKRTELIQNMEQWSDTVDYLKAVELNNNPMHHSDDASPGLFTRLSERLAQKLEAQQTQMKPEFYLENDPVSKFFHSQQVAYARNMKEKEKKEQSRQKKELLMNMSSKGVRRHLVTSGIELGYSSYDESEGSEPIKFQKLFV